MAEWLPDGLCGDQEDDVDGESDVCEVHGHDRRDGAEEWTVDEVYLRPDNVVMGLHRQALVLKRARICRDCGDVDHENVRAYVIPLERDEFVEPTPKPQAEEIMAVSEDDR